MPAWASAGLAGALGLVAFAVVSDGAFAVTQRVDPSMATLVRNRYIASALAAVGGLLLATKSPLYGVAVTAGALSAGLGAKLTFLLGEVFDKKISGMGGYQQMGDYQMGAVYGQNMGAVYGQNMGAYQLGMGAVYGQNMGDVVPAAPWQSPTPFNY